MNGLESAALLLPKEIREAFHSLPEEVRSAAEEVRLRLGRRGSVSLSSGEREFFPEEVTSAHLGRVLELATRASPYAMEEWMRDGFLTAAGGVRVGMCGRTAPRRGGGRICTELTSVSIRIPREVKDCAKPFASLPFVSTLIVSPPGAGKTTLLRDLIRIVSDQGVRISLCDERGEIAAWDGQGFGFDVGSHTDVLSDAPKTEGALRMLRVMTPRILAMDEITDPRDAAVCRRAAGCGVALLATIHAGSLAELQNRPLGRTLLAEKLFHRLIWIGRDAAGRCYREERI